MLTLRMISYGDNNDPNDNRGMNTLLNSAAVPQERCVSKAVAIENGTNTAKMSEFEAFNAGQSFPLSRLIPVWPIKESKIDTMCSTPYDSRNMRLSVNASENRPSYPDDHTEISTTDIPSGVAYNRDSYLAGYDYTFEIPSEASWLKSFRDSKLISYTIQWQDGYYRDGGVYFYADPLPQGLTSRSTYVIVHATKNQQIYNALYPNDDGPHVCETAKLFIRLGSSGSGNTIAEYTGINKITLGFRGAQDPTSTHVNTAVVYEATALSGAFYANNKLYGISEQDPNYNNYKKFVTADGNTVTIDIEYLKLQHPLLDEGEDTYYIYANWEGVGVLSNKVPVPKRNYSTSIDIIPNNDDSKLESSGIPISFGNMNIYDTNDPDSSSIRKKMCARCSCIAKVVYNWHYDKVTISKLEFDYNDNTTWEYPGIQPIFYPTTYSAGSQSGSFSWISAGIDNASTQRTFSAVSIPAGSVITVNINSKNSDYNTQSGNWISNNKAFSVEIASGSAALDYIIGDGVTTTTIDNLNPTVDISNGTSFTINLSDTTKYPVDSTHRFKLRQIIPDSDITVSTVESHNASPEYADISFTIV